MNKIKLYSMQVKYSIWWCCCLLWIALLIRIINAASDICERLVAGNIDIGVFGQIYDGTFVLFDDTSWSGYQVMIKEKDTPPPFTLNLYNAKAIDITTIFPGLSGTNRSNFLRSPTRKITNIFLLLGTVELIQAMGIRYNTKTNNNNNNNNFIKHKTEIETGANELDDIFLFAKNQSSLIIVKNYNKMPSNMVMVSQKKRHSFYGLTNENGKACLSKVIFYQDFHGVEKIYPKNRCLPISSPIRGGYYSKKTGHFTVFHANRTISTIDTGEIGLQLLENKSYSDYFICQGLSRWLFNWKIIILMLFILWCVYILCKCAINRFCKNHKNDSTKSESKSEDYKIHKCRKKLRSIESEEEVEKISSITSKDSELNQTVRSNKNSRQRRQIKSICLRKNKRKGKNHKKSRPTEEVLAKTSTTDSATVTKSVSQTID